MSRSSAPSPPRVGGPWYVDATVAYNSDGAIANYATVMLQNSILAHNGDRNCWSDLTSLGHNLEDGDDCDLTAAGDLLGTDPLLRPLAANGGGMQTHALHAGSPAIDTADDDACPAIDQRGVARPLDGDEDRAAHCDIGALEMEVTPQGYTLNLPFFVRYGPPARERVQSGLCCDCYSRPGGPWVQSVQPIFLPV